jgi:tRNA wybutosine-synthesizing protein 3
VLLIISIKNLKSPVFLVFSMEPFDQNKKEILRKKDKSSIQSIDKPIENLCKMINGKKDYFTTSSCSGRIILMKDHEKKGPGMFLFRAHEKVIFSTLKKEIEDALKISKETILFKQEPCLLAISCRDLETQGKLFSLARNNGWKRSGIVTTDKKFIIELVSTENISFPIADKGIILVSDDFLKVVLKKANSNLEKTWDKIKRLEGLIEKI